MEDQNKLEPTGGPAPPPYSENNGEVDNEEIRPPDYYTALLDREYVPDAATYLEPTVEGFDWGSEHKDPAPTENLVPDHVAESTSPGTPQVGYADFMPRLLMPGSKISTPKFDNYRSMMDFVNWWLAANPQYKVIRVESIERKVTEDGHVETETTVYHEPIFGGVMFVRGIRLWLSPRLADSKEPVQQLGYVNVVPRYIPQKLNVTHSIGTGFRTKLHIHDTVFLADFEKLDLTLERFNQQLSQYPLPGSVLTIETFDVKYNTARETTDLDPDQSFWTERNYTTRAYLSIMRVFFVQGPPTRETIGIQDFMPEVVNVITSSEYVKFGPYDGALQRASQWINQNDQKTVNVTNVQSITCKVTQKRGFNLSPMERFVLDPNVTDFTERSKTQFCYVFRVAFTMMTEGAARQPLLVSSRIFTPERTGDRDAESTSQTLARINEWLAHSGAKVLSADTLKFEFSPTCRRLQTDAVSYNYWQGRGHYWLTAIRLYFNGTYEEPPAHVLTPGSNYGNAKSSSCCVLQ